MTKTINRAVAPAMRLPTVRRLSVLSSTVGAVGHV